MFFASNRNSETRKKSEASGAWIFLSFHLMQKMYHVLLLQKDSLGDSIFGVNELLHYFSLICQPLTEGFKEILNPLNTVQT